MLQNFLACFLRDECTLIGKLPSQTKQNEHMRHGSTSLPESMQAYYKPIENHTLKNHQFRTLTQGNRVSKKPFFQTSELQMQK